MIPHYRSLLLLACIGGCSVTLAQTPGTQAWCTALSASLAVTVAEIGEPVAAVTIDSATWVTEASAPSGLGGRAPKPPVHCRIDGQLAPVDTSATARPIHFSVALPQEWNGRAIQMGGGGMNGTVPGLAGFGGQSDLAKGFITYGSDSGHSVAEELWALNDEAIKNLGYMQMKKTHDAAMSIIMQAYDKKPDYNYYVGGSQGGREALTVVQRYPNDYDGVLATVPIVGFSTLMTGPTRMRIQEKPLNAWVRPDKGALILAEFMRQCDHLDGLTDGIINNYVDCRAIFNVNDNKGPPSPWQSVQCSATVDSVSSESANCLSAGQISTLNLQFSDLKPGISLPNSRSTFGMWAPTTAVSNSGPFGGLFSGTRYKGQEGAADDAPVFTALGSIGVNGFMMQDIQADPLDFNIAEHGARYQQLAAWLDSTQSDLSAFANKGGKLIVIVGSDDTIAPSGEQLNYYQTVIDTMGQQQVDAFARLWVLPQTGHGLTGRSASIDGKGTAIESKAIPASFDRFALLTRWVEDDVAPGMNEKVSGETGSLPICSFPTYPHYDRGVTNHAASYHCANPKFGN